MNEHVEDNASSQANAELLSHYLVELAGDLYGIAQWEGGTLSWVQRPQEPTYLPTLPAWCLGLVAQRNTPVLLVDLRAVLGLAPRESAETGDQARYVFVERAGETVGFLVDRTRRFKMLPVRAAGSGDSFVTDTVVSGDQVIRILDLDRIWRFVLKELGAAEQAEAVA